VGVEGVRNGKERKREAPPWGEVWWRRKE
jgi:hypothetical protein